VFPLPAPAIQRNAEKKSLNKSYFLPDLYNRKKEKKTL